MAAIIQVPYVVSAITISGSSLVPDGNGYISLGDGDATIVWDPTTDPMLVIADIVTGNINIKLSTDISSITIGGTVYTPDAGGIIYGVPAAIGTIFLYQKFILIQGN